MENATDDMLFTTLPSQQTDYPEIVGLKPSDKIGVAIYCIIGLCGFVGNLFACIVFWSLRSNRNQVSLLIFTQALADLVTSVLLISFAITRVYRHLMPTGGSTGEWLCRFWWSRFVLFYFFAISTFNLTLISLERYVAVVHPLTYSKRFTSRNTKIFVVLIWLFCPIMQYGQSLWGYSAASGNCETVPSWNKYGQAIFGVLLYLWEYVTPICTMGICYLFIVKTLREKEKAVMTRSKSVKVKPEGRFGSVVKPTRQNSRKGITMTLLILFIIYVICWTPNQSTFVQFNLGGPLDFNGGWYLFTVILAFVNCCINPFVYAFRLRQFRVRVVRILQCQRKGIARGGESDDEFFRDPASSSKWSIRKEKLGKMFGLKRSDTQGSSVTPSSPQCSPPGTPHCTPQGSPLGTPVPVKKNSETLTNGKHGVH